jgi:hypothetical protein
MPQQYRVKYLLLSRDPCFRDQGCHVLERSWCISSITGMNSSLLSGMLSVALSHEVLTTVHKHVW